jgi:hypothetical protein
MNLSFCHVRVVTLGLLLLLSASVFAASPGLQHPFGLDDYSALRSARAVWPFLLMAKQFCTWFRAREIKARARTSGV